MSVNRTVRLAEIFYKLATEEKVPPKTEDMKEFLANLDKLETYNARKKYAEKCLKHLSSGSSRIVYLMPDQTVLKLAKNDKGIAQNKVESNPKMKSKFLNTILASSKKNIWLTTNFLNKITEKQFKEMTELDFEDFGDALRYGLKSISEHSSLGKPSCFEKIKKSSIYKEMVRIGKDFKLLPGDLARISSYGEKDGCPVLIDSGLSSEVFDSFYDSGSS